MRGVLAALLPLAVTLGALFAVGAVAWGTDAETDAHADAVPTAVEPPAPVVHPSS